MSSELEGVEEAAVVRPGDTLLLRLGKDITVEQFTRFRDSALPVLKERMPGVEVLIVGGVEQMLVHRPGGQPEGDPA